MDGTGVGASGDNALIVGQQHFRAPAGDHVKGQGPYSGTGKGLGKEFALGHLGQDHPAAPEIFVHYPHTAGKDNAHGKLSLSGPENRDPVGAAPTDRCQTAQHGSKFAGLDACKQAAARP